MDDLTNMPDDSKSRSDHSSDAEHLRRAIDRFGHDELEALNGRAVEQAEREHRDFSAAFQNGQCYLCEQPLAHFDAKQLCMHWFLRPNGVKKPHIREVLEKNGAMTSQT